MVERDSAGQPIDQAMPEEVVSSHPYLPGLRFFVHFVNSVFFIVFCGIDSTRNRRDGTVLYRQDDFMKNLNVQKWLAGIGVAVLLAGAAQAQSTQDASTANSTAPSVAAAPPLADSVAQVLQLEQAKVSDSTILSFIQNSTASYPMAASQIIYLKQQGVSDTVLNAMINAHPSMAASSAPAPAPDTSSAAQTATATAPAVTTYQTVPSSSVYVIPDSQTYYYTSGYYGYPYYYSPVAVSVGFGWGWGGYYGWHGGGWHGGYGGGWHGGYGGGWHGGGGWHH